MIETSRPPVQVLWIMKSSHVGLVTSICRQQVEAINGISSFTALRSHMPKSKSGKSEYIFVYKIYRLNNLLIVVRFK
jgi:hypothetical protein